MKLKPGEIIGEYQIIEVIGNGGFSVVYKAKDIHLLRPVAIKQFSPEYFSEEGSRDSFVREARLSASLNHPNIVATYALREQGELLFLVMEYLHGGDLHSLIAASGMLDCDTLRKVASDVCHALDTLHTRSVIHRDIKPENILIAREGHFKLADFGLAHVRQSQHRLNDASGPQPGTLLYMSPEQALGQQVTLRSDIYSLAVVLYEAMTGHYYLPYDHTLHDDQALTHLIAATDPVYPACHDPSVPDELADPLLRALSKDPALRPPTAREFLSEIKSVFSHSRRLTLSRKRRQLGPQPAPATPDLLRDLYAVRTLRDADHQPEAALQQLRALWETYSGIPEVAAEWGETLVALGRAEEGRGWLERAVQLQPALPFAQIALADLYRNRDENDDQADDALVEALHADPDLVYAVLYDDLVQSLDDPAAYDLYAVLFQRAADEKISAPALHNLGQVLALNKARQQAAIHAFELAIELDPNFGPAYVGQASLLIELNRVEAAIHLLEQATSRFFPVLPADDWHRVHTVYQRPHAFLALAVAYAQIGQFESSAIAACSVLDLDPKELEEDADHLLDAYVQAARSWIAQGDSLRAYKFLNQAIPLAAHWGKVEIFTLLDLAESKIDSEYRRKRQWDDALDRLKMSLLTVQRTLSSRPQPAAPPDPPTPSKRRE